MTLNVNALFKGKHSMPKLLQTHGRLQRTLLPDIHCSVQLVLVQILLSLLLFDLIMYKEDNDFG